MASKGPRSKLDHETRARRQKALEASREPQRPKTHWDHVLEEMVWLSKDFESERKWKLAQAKKVALRASKGILDQAARGEKKLKEEEQRLRKVAMNISKDMKKFWVKIEKLVLYKHQIELDEKKKKALDKQLEFLLGQTERYSTMLAENLADKQIQIAGQDQSTIQHRVGDDTDAKRASKLIDGTHLDAVHDDSNLNAPSEEQCKDGEHTIEEDEAFKTKEERQEELAALHSEVDCRPEELLRRNAVDKASRESSPHEHGCDMELALERNDHGQEKGHSVGNDIGKRGSPIIYGRRCGKTNGALSPGESHLLDMNKIANLSVTRGVIAEDGVPCDLKDEQEDVDFVSILGEEKDDETTLLEEEELAKADQDSPEDEIALLQKESEIPIEELLARYRKEINDEISEDDSQHADSSSGNLLNLEDHDDFELTKQEPLNENKPGPHPLLEGRGAEMESTSDGREETPNEREGSENRIADAAAAARSAQPTGNTFSTTKVRTTFPFLLKYPLREYQHIGLDWLVTMYDKRLNGILADEMGLGKTIMTIALLAHLACEKGIWGPHLIVVPTSVMLNWETEFLKWCPAFKILTYFGSAKERKFKRQGWLKLNSFHICITTYRLVIQDSKVFKRKKWKYLILDEAHLIKNWKSQRWQTLLNFNSKRRILLTGTPLQNDLMELWSLMHFLMPHIFQSHQEFKDWFSNPISGMVEGQERVNKEVVDRLHNVLRPFLLRRLKRDVEKQLPMKHEHVIYCRLSKRQRNLYEDFIASSETQATLASANFFGMISIIMQLRKVCNHPDLFEGRPIVSSFDMAGIVLQLNSFVCSILPHCPFVDAGLRDLGLVFTHLDYHMTSWESDEVRAIATPQELIKERVGLLDNIELIEAASRRQKRLAGANIFEEVRKAILEERLREAKERQASIAWWNSLRCQRKPTYSMGLRELVTIRTPVDIHGQHVNQRSYLYSSTLADIILPPVERFQRMIGLIESFMFAIPAARAPEPACWCSKPGTSVFLHPTYKEKCSEMLLPLLSPIRPAIVRRQVYFPDRRLIQFDCGKLQELAALLRRLKSEGHRALIFTQMTKMLDILEAFINLYGYTYMRLDGSTQPEERQTLMQRFNTNPKIFLFILSTRSGGVGINLVGADTVIFYDSDWNPAMDQQAQDRCHRIGQTREVHIYRLISESTIEENILRKANQKRALDDLVIQSGDYNTEFFKKLDPMELFSGHDSLPVKSMQKGESENIEDEILVSNADVEAALKYAEDEADYMALKRVEQEEAVDNQEFTEETMGKMEDDDFINDEDMKADEPAEREMITTNKDCGLNLNGNESIEEGALKFSENLDDVDMLADVREMAAAAAAAGQAISSFENQLRPIDRYAIRFLELWDPVIDKTALDYQERFEETEWELERIEKYKEEMEADIDDDDESFVYERWDTDFATKAYRQQVEALAQHQLEEELQAEANEKEDGDGHTNATMNGTRNNRKPKSKRKAKKAKFRSLKKGSLTCKMKHIKEEPSMETMSFEDEVMSEDASYLEMMSPLSSAKKKRKKGASTVDVEANKSSKKKLKKAKKAPEKCLSNVDLSLFDKRHGDHVEFRQSDNIVANSEPKLTSRSKMGGKISITFMPVKRVLTIKPEKLKKGNVWSRDCVPSPDLWLPQEDAILCAIVHEYGPNWNLVSETIYGMTAGGVYRGRYRHPVHCCERYRELIQRFVLSAPETPINEKITSMGSGKALLRVSEDNIRMLLSVAAEQPDPELLLQKHFTALLSSVWRVTSHVDQRKRAISQNGTFFGGRFFRSVNPISRSYMKEPVKRKVFCNLGDSKKLLAAALHETNNSHSEVTNYPSNQRDDATPNSDQLEVTLEFLKEEGDSLILMPGVINLSIPVSDLSTSLTEDMGEGHHLKSSKHLAEIRFRDFARACLEDGPGSASSAFLADEVNMQPTIKLQSLGKHKLSSSDSIRSSKQLKRTSLEDHEQHHLDTEPVFQSLPTITSKELNAMFDSASIVFHDLCMDHMDSSITSCSDNELPDSWSFEVMPHEYIPGLLSGLDESAMWPEYTDVG